MKIKNVIPIVICLLMMRALSINQQCIYENVQHGINDSCPINSRCMQNNYCGCNSGYIGNCSQEAFIMENNVKIQTNISDKEYTFFSISQSVNQYVILMFNLCHEQQYDNSQYINVWDDDGNLETLNNSNLLPGGIIYHIQSGCFMISTSLIQFDNQPNGLPSNLVIGLKLVKPGQVKLNFSVQIDIFDFWDLFYKFLLIIGSILFFLFSLTIAVFVYKWKRRRRHINNPLRQQNDISHLNLYMPVFILNSKTKKQLIKQLCSVCLLEFYDGQKLRQTTCQHVFHQECIDQWCKSNLNCPICRNSLELSELLQRNTGNSINFNFQQLQQENKRPLL